MIKFFRKIRQQLLTENKPALPSGRFRKYFIYAVGEIVLVVIGILIALSINNWNENRKLQNEEINLLSDIKLSLISAHEDLVRDSLTNQKLINQYKKIDYYIENDLKYNTELDSAFGGLTFWGCPFFKSSAYKTLQTKGLDLIKNNSIRKDIVSIYEIDLELLILEYDKSEWSMHQMIVTPFFSKHVRRLHETSLRLSRPNDFESLKQNDEFRNILSMIIR